MGDGFGVVDVRHLRRSVRRHDGRRGAAAASGRERGADLRYNLEITLEEAFHGKTAAITHADFGRLRSLLRLRREAPARKPATCKTCGGHGRVRAQQGFFAIERTCPTCHGRGADDRKPLRQMRRRRPRDPGAHAVGQRSRRRRGRHPHPPDRRGRGGNARRPGGRSLHFPLDQAARVLPARRRRPLLPGADLDGAGRARRRIQRPDARRVGRQGHVPEGTQSGTQFRLRGKGMPVLRARDSATCTSSSSSRRRKTSRGASASS